MPNHLTKFINKLSENDFYMLSSCTTYFIGAPSQALSSLVRGATLQCRMSWLDLHEEFVGRRLYTNSSLTLAYVRKAERLLPLPNDEMHSR